MKKIMLFLVPLMAMAFSGCTGNNKPVDPTGPVDPTDPVIPEKLQTYNFYIDFWHSDEVFYTMKWYQGEPLGVCPSQCMLTSSDATDPAFPTFLGWSTFSTSLDESQLWDFANSASVNATVNLYGIWVG